MTRWDRELFPPGAFSHGRRQYFDRCGCDACTLWRKLRAEHPDASKVELRILAIKAQQAQRKAAR